MRLSLIHQIFIWVLIPVACVVGFVYYQLYSLSHNLKEGLERDLVNSVNQVERQLKMVLDTTDQLADMMSRNDEIVTACESRKTDFLYRWGKRLIASELLDTVTFLDPDGLVLARGHEEYGFNDSLADSPLFKRGLNRKSFSGIAEYDGDLSLVTVKAVVQYGAIIRGILIVTRKMEPEIRSELEHAIGVTLSFVRDGGQPGSQISTNAAGIMRVSRPIEFADIENKTPAVTMSKDYSTEHRHYQSVKSKILWFTVLSTCAVLFLVYLSVRHLLKPLRVLHLWLERYHKGNFDKEEITRRLKKLPPKSNELGLIAHTAFTTIDELETTRKELLASNQQTIDAKVRSERVTEELQHLYQNLETLVAERTKQLNMEVLERKQAERRSRNLKNQLQSIFDSMPSVLVGIDSKGVITHWNEKAARLSGIESRQAIGTHFNETAASLGLGHGIDTSSLNLNQTVRHRDVTNDRESHYEISCSPFRYEQDEGMVVRVDDVSDRVLMEQALLKAEKIKSIGVLAGGIAHDFNNLLTAILGNISILKMKFGDNSTYNDLLANAEKASLRAKSLTHQLLTFSKGGSPVKRTTNLAEIVKDATRLSLTGEQIKCNCTIAENLWTADADKDQISQVIENIVLNAWQAAGDDGNIQVTCTNNVVTTNEQASRLLKPGNYVIIDITDDGPGIDEETLEHIFDPYFTTKKEGNGLGLAICHSIIKKHNGVIEVESRPGSGTTFSIRIPVIINGSPDTLPTDTDESPPEGKKILVMDDDPMILELANSILQQLGHQPVLAENGEKAVAFYQQAMEGNEAFDLTIMDLVVHKGMGGKDAAAHILSLDSDARIIVSSGYSNDPVMSNFEKYGFRDSLAKPYGFKELDTVLKRTMLQ